MTMIKQTSSIYSISDDDVISNSNFTLDGFRLNFDSSFSYISVYLPRFTLLDSPSISSQVSLLPLYPCVIEQQHTISEVS